MKDKMIIKCSNKLETGNYKLETIATYKNHSIDFLLYLQIMYHWSPSFGFSSIGTDTQEIV